VIVVFAGFFAWGVAMVVVDARAKRHQRRQAERDATADPAKVAEEAERWLQDH
jgi:hypothetical protein